ncbi:MAG: acyltransferase [Coriobacteriaceae bacterium]|nr:acyltransferase [Coriobacteriaceae bacterium]
MLEEKQRGSVQARIFAYDLIRSVAICSVVLCHAVEFVYAGTAGGFAYSLLHALGRIGVPLFLFLTGALLIKRDFTDESSIKAFYKKNLFTLFVSCELWIIIYAIYFGVLTSFNRDLFVQYLKWATFQELVPLTHWWYMPFIIVTYVTLPFLSRMVSGISFKTFVFPGMLLLVLTFILPTYNGLYANAIGRGPWDTVLDATFLGRYSIFYLVIGYFILEKKELKRVPLRLLLILGSISLAGCVHAGLRWDLLWYDSFWVLLFSIVVCELLFRVCCSTASASFFNARRGPSRLVTITARMSFGVFLVHTLLLPVVGRVPYPFGSHAAAALLYGVVLLLLSLLVVIVIFWMLRKTPKLRALIVHA